MFTGRRVDILNSGSLKIQYNRNRYYDQYTARWLTHDPLDYVDGLNLYHYGQSSPTTTLDPFGLIGPPLGGWNPYWYNPDEASFGDWLSDMMLAARLGIYWWEGTGDLWTDGATNVKRQSDVRGPVASELELFATQRCISAKKTCTTAEGNIYKTGLQVVCQDTWPMIKSLRGSKNFIIAGSYELESDCKKCKVTFDNKYTFIDNSKLHNKYTIDLILKILRAFGKVDPWLWKSPRSHGKIFPIRIGWSAKSSVTIIWGDTKSEDPRKKSTLTKTSGWPFEK